jgi:hypothetical protein
MYPAAQQRGDEKCGKIEREKTELDINDRIILKVILHKYMTVKSRLGLLTTPITCVTPQVSS